jgi:hypothetical protein
VLLLSKGISPELERKFEKSVNLTSEDNRRTRKNEKGSHGNVLLKLISHYAGCVCFHPVNSKLTPAVRTPFKAKC